MIHEKPQPVPTSPASVELRLLCLFFKDRDGSRRVLPVHTMQPVPPRVGIQGKWSLARDPGLLLLDTHAKQATAQVLARCLLQRQTHSIRSVA